MTLTRSARPWSAVAVALIFTLAAVDGAEARRGGSFGSRGMRTYAAPRPTYAAPASAAPIQRSMTPRDQAAQPGFNAQRPAANTPFGQPQRGGFLRRWGGPILGGLMVAGLFGMLAGHGFGGAAGLTALMLQLGLLALVGAALVWLFRRGRAQPQAAGVAARMGAPISQYDFQPAPASRPSVVPLTARPAPGPADDGDEIGVGLGDFDTFEKLLTEVQSAFGREDYAALRERTTAEIMSYLAEELSQNAVQGRRNDVSAVRLLQGDLSEAWREDERDYATVAMRYASIDVMRDRATGKVVEGDADRPTETVELWTFVRDRAGPWGAGWKLSAIQEQEPARA